MPDDAKQGRKTSGGEHPATERPAVHAAEWTPARITSFWENYGSIPHFRSRFFSLTWSEGVLDFASRYVAEEGIFLDYGCGRGDLLAALLGRGRRGMGCDSSIENVRATAARLAGTTGFLGVAVAPDPQLPARPDTVMLVEVLEHVPREAVVGFLKSIAALLAPGGHVVVTCPNQEDLARAEVLCPECGCCFHPVQHLQSLAPEDVAGLAERAGFEAVFRGATRFRKLGEWRITARIFAGWYALFGKSPHLVYVGRKRGVAVVEV